MRERKREKLGIVREKGERNFRRKRIESTLRK